MEPETDYGGPNHPAYAKQAAMQAQALQSRAGYGSDSAIAPAAPSFFDQISSRLQTLGAMLNDTTAELTMLGDRVFGGQPQNKTSGSKGVPVGNGHAGSVLEAFDALLNVASENAQRARALNSRL